MKTWVKFTVWILVISLLAGLVYLGLWLAKSAILWLLIIYFG